MSTTGLDKTETPAQLSCCRCCTDPVSYRFLFDAEGRLYMRLFLYVQVALAIAGLCVAVAPANAAGCSQRGRMGQVRCAQRIASSLAQEVNDFKKGKGA